MLACFTTQEEQELYDYRMQTKKELLSYAELNYSELANKLIKLFYSYILASSLYNVNLKKRFTEDELKILVEKFGEQFNKDFYSGLHYSQYEMSWYGYPLVMEKGSSYLGFVRSIAKFLRLNEIIDGELDVLIIHLTNVKNDFFGNCDAEPTTLDQQKEVIENFLKEHSYKNLELCSDLSSGLQSKLPSEIICNMPSNIC